MQTNPLTSHPLSWNPDQHHIARLTARRLDQPVPARFEFTTLNRNEFAMSREDDFAQSDAVRAYLTGSRPFTETELIQLGISVNEPMRTIRYTDDPEELEALASQSTKAKYHVAYADGRIIHREPTGKGSWARVTAALNGYVATQRLVFEREAEAPTIDTVSATHFEDLAPVPFPEPESMQDWIARDKIPSALRDIWEWGDEDEDEMSYIEGVSEAAALGYRAFRPAPNCE